MRAIVAELHCPAIAGTTFLVNNDFKQDFHQNQIFLLGNKFTVPIKHREALLLISKFYMPQISSLTTYSLPIDSMVKVGNSTLTQHNTPAQHNFSSTLTPPKPSLFSLKTRRILMPGDSISKSTDMPKQLVVVEAY